MYAVGRGTIQEKGVVGDGGVDRLGLAEGIGRRPVGTSSTTMGIVTCILKRGAHLVRDSNASWVRCHKVAAASRRDSIAYQVRLCHPSNPV